MTTPLIVIPFGGRDPARLEALAHVAAFYEDNFPDWPRVLATGELPFNRAQVINQAVRAAWKQQIVVFNDADTLCTPEQVLEAVRLATVAPGFVFAYTLYLRLSRRRTERLGSWRDALAAPAEWGMVNAGSQGCSAVQRDYHLELGGLDERFVGWGYEDLEYNHRLGQTPEGIRRVDGELRHLWHGDRSGDNDAPLAANPADVQRNWRLYTELVP